MSSCSIRNIIIARTSQTDWFSIGIDAWELGIDMAMVISMRMERIIGGGAIGRREAERMVDEKLRANWLFGLDLMAGALGGSPASVSRGALRHYGRPVRANRRRLARG